MLRVLAAKAGYRLVPLLSLTGCLVSFNDYPLDAGSGGGAVSNAGGGGGASGAAATAGKASGGTSGSATSGAAGTTASGGQATSAVTMIDDFEDGDDDILEHAGRSGAWYAGNDGQGMQTPPANSALLPSLLSPQRGASRRAAHTYGGPFAQWGALIGTSLASGEEYDLSAYEGIRFWVRSGSMDPAAARQVRFMLPTPQTNPGGSCTICNDHFGALVPLTPQWTLIELELAELRQEGYGRPNPPGPELDRVISIQFLFPQDVSFDLWVDDVELF